MRDSGSSVENSRQHRELTVDECLSKKKWLDPNPGATQGKCGLIWNTVSKGTTSGSCWLTALVKGSLRKGKRNLKK